MAWRECNEMSTSRGMKVRDYRKFMVDDAIEPALLPLDVWNTLFDEYQNKPGNFYKGFKRLGVLRLRCRGGDQEGRRAGQVAHRR